MVDDVMYLLCIEFMQYRHGNGAVGECSQESYGPVAAVASADSYLVAFHDVAVLKQDMNFLDFASYIVELECSPLIVCQGVLIPVLGNGIFNVFIET